MKAAHAALEPRGRRSRSQAVTQQQPQVAEEAPAWQLPSHRIWQSKEVGLPSGRVTQGAVTQPVEVWLGLYCPFSLLHSAPGQAMTSSSDNLSFNDSLGFPGLDIQSYSWF